MTVYDDNAPLPQQGTTLVLEASAGTGKTHALTTLAVRHIVERGVPVDQVMIVTFSNASARELRSRMQGRLRESADVLTGARPREAVWTDDPVERDLRLRRCRLALDNLDRAMISTTHQFCDRMLAALGVLADHDDATTHVADLDPLPRQSATDLFLRHYAASPRPPFGYPVALEMTNAVIEHPAVDLGPTDATGPETAARIAFAAQVRDEVEHRKRVGGLYTFDDMLLRVRAALQHPQTGGLARAAVQKRFPVVLVDEFQDTDPVQWAILRLAFAERSTMVLIGDPKQAIYGFRAADLHTYLAARASAEVQSLDVNRRAGPALVRATSSLLTGLNLGDTRVQVTEVETTPDTDRLVLADGDPWAAPVRIRVPRETDPRSADEARSLIDADLTSDVADLLASGAILSGPRRATGPIAPADVAVIVSSNARGRRVLTALAGAGIPAVFTGSQGVFASDAAADWLEFLAALDQPRSDTIRRAALTSLIGWDVARLASTDDSTFAALTAQIRVWSRLLRDQGPAAVFDELTQTTGLTQRLVACTGGERTVTDLRHIAQLLQVEQHRSRLASAGLLSWLRARIERSTGDEANRRLETDAQAVQIMTVHQAKGLQFPVVYLPEAADRFVREEDEGRPILLHPATGLVLDVGGTRAAGRAERVAVKQAEDGGESLRTLYVALTRATCHTIAWWVPTKHTTMASPLHRVLFGSRPDPDLAVPLAADPMAALAGRTADDGVAVEVIGERVVRAETRSAPAVVPVLRAFTREIDRTWRRTSYSALTATSHHGPEPTWDEPPQPDDAFPVPTLSPARVAEDPEGPPPGSSARLSVESVSPMADLPGGVGFGSLVHAVFERFETADEESVRALVDRQLARTPMPGVGVDELTAALLPALHTPLGPIGEGLSLAEVPLEDRLAELDFELPLAAGPGASPGTLRELADLLARQLEPDDPLASYPDRLREVDHAGAVLQGFLTGSIDVVARVGEPRRHLVIDYKTNRMRPPGEPLLLGHYTPSAMAEAMMDSHYPLQALLYSVALHRFLRWRLPGYDPDVHLGGIAYLFVRGMAGPDTPQVDGTACGVFTWRPSSGIVIASSDLLAGRTR